MSDRKRKCVWIDPLQAKWNPRLDTDGYIPSVVTEGVAGHNPLTGSGDYAEPWFWGKTLAEAEETAATFNMQNFGLPKLEAWTIVASSVAATAMPLVQKLLDADAQMRRAAAAIANGRRVRAGLPAQANVLETIPEGTAAEYMADAEEVFRVLREDARQ